MPEDKLVGIRKIIDFAVASVVSRKWYRDQVKDSGCENAPCLNVAFGSGNKSSNGDNEPLV